MELTGEPHLRPLTMKSKINTFNQDIPEKFSPFVLTQALNISHPALWTDLSVRDCNYPPCTQSNS